MATLRDVSRRLRDALVASDPGLLRLRLAATATASMVVSLGVMTGIARLTGQPVTAVLLGVIVSMVAAISVNDPETGAQRLTTVLLPVPAAAAVALGTLLTGHRIVADVVFVAIMVAAVYVRRFGPRATALGQVGFQSYFFTQFLGAQVEQLPWLVLALVVGTACTLVLRGVVFAERPERTLRRTVAAFRARAAGVVAGVHDAVAAGRLPNPGGRPLRLRLARLNETALLVADILERTDAEQAWPGVPNRTLALRIFDAELTVERLVGAAEQLVCAEHPVALDERADLVAALARLRDGLGTVEVPDPLARRTGDSPSRRLAAAIHRASLAMCDAGSGEAPELAAIEEPGDDDEPDSDEPGLRPSTRQAIQVGMATSLAIVAGEFISPSRWYWAVITAFIVFTNTTSRGEILSRGWQRTVGTVAGVVAGIGVAVAVAVGGNTVVSLVTLFCCVFLGFYLMRVSQGLFMFWLTAVLALLYGLLGRFSIDVLVVRLEETAAGAVIGIAVASLVLPHSTRATVSGHVTEFLSGLDELLDAAVRDLAGDGDADAQRLLAKARKLDQTLLTLRTASRPLTTGLSGLSGRGGFRRTMRTLAACERYARGLARLATQASGSLGPARLALTGAADAVRANVRALQALFEQPQDRMELTDVTELLDAAEDLAPDAEHAAAVRFLRRLDGAVTGLAIDRGAPRPAEPASAAARS
ncbi:MAG: FUSC family protein [Pseudonocardiaceae bacterium]